MDFFAQVVAGLTVTAAVATGVTLATVFGSPFSLIIVPFTLPCLWPAISRGCCGLCHCGRACMEHSNPMGSGDTGGLALACVAYVSPQEEWPCCEKPRNDKGCRDVCVALEQGIKCGGGEREKKVRWGEKEGCVSIVEEIPKGKKFIYIPNIEHEPGPALKEKKEKKKKSCC